MPLVNSLLETRLLLVWWLLVSGLNGEAIFLLLLQYPLVIILNFVPCLLGSSVRAGLEA